MKHLTSRIGTPHRFPLGHQRRINGEQCTLIGFTVAGRPRYRGPSGTYTFYERTSYSQAVRNVGQEFIAKGRT